MENVLHGEMHVKMQKELKTPEMLAFGMGSVGNNLIYGLITSYLLIFYTDTFGITAAVAGLIIFMAKIWDGINDTFMGIIVDNTQTKMGKFRPYLLVVPVVMAVATTLCFTVPNLSPGGKIAYAAITYIFWGMSFTAMDIPYWSMSASITQDPNKRSKVVAIARSFATIANIIAFVLVLPLVGLLGGGNETAGWQRMAMTFGIIAIVFTWITFFNVKERIQVAAKEKQTIAQYLHQLKENDALRNIILSMLLYETAFAFKFAFLQYYIKYNFNAQDMIPVVMGVVAIGSIIGSILATVLGKRLPKKNLIMISILVQSIVGVILFFIGYGNLTIIIAINALLAIFDGLCLIMFYTLITNTVEYGQYKTGVRREGVVFSINIFKTKIAGAIGIGVGALALQMVGFVANEVQSTGTLTGIHAFFTIIPSVLLLFVFIPIRHYTLTEARYQEILTALEGVAHE